MLKRLRKNKKAQNTAEYAILIALVVAAAIAMQTYVQRALQARTRSASQYLQDETGLGTELQYEPYYLSSNYTVSRSEIEREFLSNATTSKSLDSRRTREVGGFQQSSFNASEFTGPND